MKRARYSDQDLAQFALETGGRIGNEARAFLGRMADAADNRHSELQYLQRAISSVLQNGVAMLLQPKLGSQKGIHFCLRSASPDQPHVLL